MFTPTAAAVAAATLIRTLRRVVMFRAWSIEMLLSLGRIVTLLWLSRVASATIAAVSTGTLPGSRGSASVRPWRIHE